MSDWDDAATQRIARTIKEHPVLVDEREHDRACPELWVAEDIVHDLKAAGYAIIKR